MRFFFQKTPKTAAEWIARLNSGTATAGDFAALSSWLERSPENRSRFEAAEAMWGLASQLSLSSRARSYLAEGGRTQAPGRFRLTVPAMAGVGAALCAVLLAVFVLGGIGSYSTGIGQRDIIALADGSTIWLNTSSRVKIDMDERCRSVVLVRGEAFFKVAHDTARPFVVEANGRRIVVTGTQFDVRSDAAAVEVAVLEGHVRVDHGPDGEPGEEQARGGAGETTTLSAGQQARFAGAARPVVEVNRTVERKAAWREGKIYFDNTSLGAALGEINRYSRTKLVLGDPRLRTLSISGVFRTGDLDSVLFAVRELYRLEARQEGGEIVLSQVRS